MNFARTLFSTLLLASVGAAPALAKGEITVEYENGDTDTYSSVEIANTPEILYLKAEEGNTILMVTKKECTKEGEILVCNKARVGLDTNGILEELKVRQIFLFINPTAERQPIKGSEITMSPNTILLEFVTVRS